MYNIGIHRVDGRSYWFGGYFGGFRRELMSEYAGAARADRFAETFAGQVPLADARLVKVYDPEDPVAAQQFAATFGVPVAGSLAEFADGLDAVVVPFPSGGPRRDYAVTAPLAERGLPLFLDRIILEQTDVLRALMSRCAAARVPLHVTCFVRYLAPLLLPEPGVPVRRVTASTGGDAVGYGADLLDLVDELLQAPPVQVCNRGDAHADVLRLGYADGREAELRLLHDSKPPMTVTVTGDGWTRSLTLGPEHNHLGAFRQFQAFVRAIATREPPVPYQRVLASAAVLQVAQRRLFGETIPIAATVLGT